MSLIPMLKNYLREPLQFTHGAYGAIYKGYTKILKKEVVFKECNKFHENAKNEIKVLNKVDNIHIVRLLNWDYADGSQQAGGVFWMVLEYCNEGELFAYCKKNKPALEFTIDVTRQAAKGLKYLHNLETPIIHRDIQPRNILLHTEAGVMRVKLCDFGTSKIGNEEVPVNKWLVSYEVGTELFKAPEMFDWKEYTRTLDTFSLGLVLESMFHYGQGKSGEFLPAKAFPPRDAPQDMPYGKYLSMKKMSCSIVRPNSDDDTKYKIINTLIDEMTKYNWTERPDMETVIAELDSTKAGIVKSLGFKPTETVLMNRDDFHKLKESPTYKDYGSQIRATTGENFIEIAIGHGKYSAKSIKEKLIAEEEKMLSKYKDVGYKTNKNADSSSNILVDMHHWESIESSVDNVLRDCAIGVNIQEYGKFCVIALNPKMNKISKTKERILDILDKPFVSKQSTRGAASNTGHGGVRQRMTGSGPSPDTRSTQVSSSMQIDRYLFREIIVQKADLETRSRFKAFQKHFRVNYQFTARSGYNQFYSVDLSASSALIREEIYEVFENIFLKYVLECYLSKTENYTDFQYPYGLDNPPMYEGCPFAVEYNRFISENKDALRRFKTRFDAQLTPVPHRRGYDTTSVLNATQRMSPKEVRYMNLLFENIMLRDRVRRKIDSEFWKNGQVVY